MLNVYVDQKDIAQLPVPASPGPVTAVQVELLDMPLTVSLRRTGDLLQINAYVRYCPAGTDVLRGSAVYSFATGQMRDVTGYAPLLEFMQSAYLRLSALLASCSENGDVLLTVQNGQPQLQLVAGPHRPTLVCADRNDPMGQKQFMGRPYQDEQAADPLAAARQYLSGAGGTPVDPARAVQLTDSLARSGNGPAQTAMAVYCAVGCGVPKDLSAAAQWAQLAVQTGDPEAGTIAQAIRSIPALEQQSASGDAKAQAALAGQYIALAPWLPGIAQSALQPAIMWALKAAAQNESAGFQALGVCYENGYGTPPDPARASAAYRRAAGHQAPAAQQPAVSAAAAAPVEQKAADVETKTSAARPQQSQPSSSSSGGSKEENSAYRKAYGQWKRAIAAARDRRHPKIAKALAAEQAEIEQSAKQEYEAATAPLDGRLAELQQAKAAADAALAATGLFQRAERKERKDAADKAAAELEALQAEFQQARSRMETRVGGSQREAYKKLPEILAEVDQEIPLPAAPDNPYGFTPVTGIDNYAELREAVLGVLSSNTRPLTIREMRMRSELIDECPDDSYRICRDLCDEGAAIGAQKNGVNTYALSEDGRWEVLAVKDASPGA